MNKRPEEITTLPKSSNILFLCLSLLAAILVYASAYFATVTVVTPLSTPTITTPSYGAMERLGTGKLGSSVERVFNALFRPIHWIDRQLRPDVWRGF